MLIQVGAHAAHAAAPSRRTCPAPSATHTTALPFFSSTWPTYSHSFSRLKGTSGMRHTSTTPAAQAHKRISTCVHTLVRGQGGGHAAKCGNPCCDCCQGTSGMRFTSTTPAAQHQQPRAHNAQRPSRWVCCEVQKPGVLGYCLCRSCCQGTSGMRHISTTPAAQSDKRVSTHSRKRHAAKVQQLLPVCQGTSDLGYTHSTPAAHLRPWMPAWQ